MDLPKTAAAPGPKTVIVPAAGLGTRFLPATKTVPKELLPVVDTPGIELIAEEAAEIGAQRLAIITAPAKKEVLAHFGDFSELVATLQERGKEDQAAKVRRASELITPVAVEQDEPLGLGHAVGLAESVLDEDEDVVAVMLPDDLVIPAPGQPAILAVMAAVRQQLGGSVVCAFDVPREDVFNYGVFAVREIPADKCGELSPTHVKCVVDMVEKPDPSEAPSTLVAAGRYLLDRAVFDALRRIKPGKGGELQLTDAIELMIKEGHPVHVVVHEGTRHDLGNPAGYIPANVDFGLRHPDYGPTIYRSLKTIIENYESDNSLG